LAVVFLDGEKEAVFADLPSEDPVLPHIISRLIIKTTRPPVFFKPLPRLTIPNKKICPPILFLERTAHILYPGLSFDGSHSYW
jgi:hypothetical protein